MNNKKEGPDTDVSKPRPRKYVHWEVWGVRLSALLTLLMGIINLTSAVQPALQDRLALIRTILPLEAAHGGRLTSALAGFALILLASSLWRRKRTSWVLIVILLGISITAHLIKGLDFEEASLGLGLLILLILLRKSFHAASDRPSLRQGLIVLVSAFAFTLIYGSAGFYLLDKHFHVSYNLPEAIRQTVVMFTSFYNPAPVALTSFGKYFIDSIYVIGLGTLGFALLMLIRPVLVRLPATTAERERATEIINQHGRTALARPALFEDKSYFFGPEETVIAYAASQRGAMALGDPIGPPAQAAEAILRFRDFCARNDWTPSFLSTLPDYLEAYQTAGFDAVCIGFEAIVDLKDFTLEGGKHKGIRYTVSHLERSGFHAAIHLPPLDDSLMASLQAISNAWLTLHHGGEMRFSDGWFNDSYVRNSPVIVVHAPDGTPTAFANLVPEFTRNEVTIDLMRHYARVEPGTMEFLFAKMLLWARENQYQTFSLGLSAIIGVGEKPDDPRVEQALHSIATFASRSFNFKGLHDFKEKFHPRWEPRYLVYPGPASLPLVLSTLLAVHSGNDYLWKFLQKKPRHETESQRN
jgi:phosphatidylglycerol lysyltransferase